MGVPVRASVARLEKDALALIADAAVAACGIDRRHRIVYWNDSMTALLGWTAADVLGKRCFDAFAGRDVFGNRCCFRDCGVALGARRGEVPEPFLMEIRNRDGAPVRLVTRTIVFPPGEAYTTLIHLFEAGDRLGLSAATARVRAAVSERPETHPGPPEPSVALSRRELEILVFLASGYRSVNIAARLSLSHATVRNHIQNLLRRLEVHSQVEAVSVAYRRGLLGREEVEATVGFEPTNEAFAEPSLDHLGTSPRKEPEADLNRENPTSPSSGAARRATDRAASSLPRPREAESRRSSRPGAP